MILAGDVGGTKTILALFEVESDGFRCLKKEHFPSAYYQTFIGLLESFLSDMDGAQITAVCIGAAGPIVKGNCEATNLPWVLNRIEIGECVNTQHVWLLNDLEATAWGLLELPEQSFVELNPDAQWRQGNHAVLAAGTGLGEAIIVWDGDKHHVMATEGGHADFAPNSEREIALLGYLIEKYPEHVSYERLLSGEGLVNIYQFLKQIKCALAQSYIEQQMTERDPAAVIGEAGITGSDALCIEALKLFCRIYGAESGNLALKCLPYAGVYLAGGIGAKILPVLQDGEFMRGFLSKGRSQS
ncbi:MAG: glucokinase, partial [Methylobacter sp.]|nr:glucokinase [Methylobacter sp.]